MNRYKYKLTAATLAAVLVFGSLSPVQTTAASKIRLNKKKVTLLAGAKVKLKLKKARKKVKWSSSRKKVASVSQKGVVTAKKAGTAKITAKSAGKKYICRVTVKSASANASTGKNPLSSAAPGASASPKPSASPNPSASSRPGTSTTTSSQTKPASAEADTLTVGKISVRIGMTKAEVEQSAGAKPDRTDTSQLGMEEYIYNPSADYTNYLLVQFADGKVVGMSTISPYFCYASVVSSSDTESQLKAKGFDTGTVSTYYYAEDADGNKKGTSAYLLKQTNASVVAFVDYWGAKEVYGVQVFSNAYTLDKLNQPKLGTYTDAVLTSAEAQLYDLLMAFRVYKNSALKPRTLTRTTQADNVAKTHSQDMAKNDYCDTKDSAGIDYKGDSGRLVAAGIDYQYAGEYVFSGCSDGISAANTYIHKKNSRSAVLSETNPYTCIGVGAAYNVNTSMKTYFTMDIYSLFDE